MAIPFIPVLCVLIAGKIVTVNYEVFKRVKARSVNKMSTLDLIDEQIAELSKALDGKAGEHAQVEINRLRILREQIEKSGNPEDHTVGDFVDEVIDASGETVNRVRCFIADIRRVATEKVERFQRKMDEFKKEDDAKK